MENPKCPYCGEEMLATAYSKASLKRSADWARGNSSEKDTRYCFQCVKCEAESPLADTFDEAYAAAMMRENKYREQVEYDVKAALNTLNDNFHKMPYYIYSMLFDQISAIGYAPTCGADMRKEKDDEP